MSAATAATHLLLVGALTVGASACGGSTDAGSDKTPPRASPTEKVLTAAEAKVVAEASLLKAADLTGYKATPADKTTDPEEEKTEAELEKCIGSPSPDYLAEEVSDDFSMGDFPATTEVSSEVQVVKTEAEGKADLSAFRSEKALACFETFFGKALKDLEANGVKVAGTDVERFDVAKPVEAFAAFGLRVKGTVSAPQVSTPFSIGIAGALVGRAELSVLSFAFGDTLPKAEFERLLGVMSTRAFAAQA